MTVAMLRNPNYAEQPDRARGIAEGRQRTLGLQLLVLNVTTPNEFDTAFATVVQKASVRSSSAIDPFLEIGVNKSLL